MSWTDTLFQASVFGSEASMTILSILIIFSDGNCFEVTLAFIRCEFVPVSNIYVRLEEESYVVLIQKAFMHETGVKRHTVTNRKISWSKLIREGILKQIYQRRYFFPTARSRCGQSQVQWSLSCGTSIFKFREANIHVNLIWRVFTYPWWCLAMHPLLATIPPMQVH